MNQSKKIWYLSAAAFLFVFGVSDSFAQGASRVKVTSTISSRPTNQPPAPAPQQVKSSADSRPTNVRPPLVQDIQVQKSLDQKELVRKTVSSSATSNAIIASRSIYSTNVTSSMQRSIFTKLGIPYLYGSSGPNRYDCSGFVWAVFQESGIDFERSSARNLWADSTPVEGDERFRFGTLVFFNGLGHMGIVADENGFYHASSSKGITYSTFKGYWQNRIVGFRRLNNTPAAPVAPMISEK